MYEEIFDETDCPSEITSSVHIFVLGDQDSITKGGGSFLNLNFHTNFFCDTVYKYKLSEGHVLYKYLLLLKKSLCLASLGIIRQPFQFVGTRFIGLLNHQY